MNSNETKAVYKTAIIADSLVYFTILLVVLKSLNVMDISWFWVFAPLIPYGLLIIGVFLLLICMKFFSDNDSK
jgi:hypothetical protein